MAQNPYQITTLSSLKIVPESANPNNGFYLPNLTTAQITAIPTKVLENGLLALNTTLNQVVVRVNGALYTLSLTPLGQGFVFPSFVNDAAVTTPVNGMVYYNTTTNKLKLRANGAWETITSA